MLHLGAAGILLRRSGEAFGTNVLVLMPIAIIAGWCSYRYIEQPTQRLAFQSDRRKANLQDSRVSALLDRPDPRTHGA